MKNYASNKALTEKAAKIYTQVEQGYKEEKKGQSDDINEWWDVYNCSLNGNQQYDGDAKIYEPIVRDALEARRKRFTAMLFPNVGNNIECISEQGDTPQATMAILQRHIRHTDLRALVPTVLLNGDVEGQWSLMLDWKRTERKVTRKVKTETEGVEVVDISREKVITEGPEVTVVAAQDLWFFPATVADIQDAEIVSVSLRLTDDALEDMIDDGVLVKSAVDAMQKDAGEDKNKWADKLRTADAGVKIKAGQKFTLVYMVFTKLKLDGEKKPAVIYFGGQNNILGIVENPHWSGKIPLITEPVLRVAGTLWGKSMIQPVAPLAYQLNDITNMGMDSAQYTVLPIVMTDPVKNPRVSSMILGKAAIWETSPDDTSIAQFPPLYQHALTLRNAIKAQIMESLDVNETMLGRSPAGRKNAQAVAQQSSEALATIGDVVKRFENAVMNKLLEWFYEMDLQYRDEDLMVVRDGEHGEKAILETIPVQQVNNRYSFRWLGADKAIGMQTVQQMIGFMNVLRGMPPQVLNGRRLDIGPILDFAAEATFGPTLSQNILIDERHKVSIPAETENEMMLNNLPVNVSPLDDDVAHIREHQQGAQQTGDPTGLFRDHIAKHMQAIQAKQPQPQPPQGQQGVPGGAGPGVPGTPRPGAQPMPGRNAQNPAGAIHSDQMADPMAQPRG